MKKLPYLRSRQRRGRWTHYYKRFDPAKGKEVEVSLGVHGLHPADPRVLAAWAAEHARWQEAPPDTPTPKAGTFAWAVDLLKAHHSYTDLAAGTRKSHDAIARRYVKAQGQRPVSTITASDIERALYAKGGHGAVNELKVLRRIFKHLKKMQFIAKDPTAAVDIEKPKIKGFATADADDIQRFQEQWPIGTVERLIFDLALLTGAARADVSKLGRRHIKGDLLVYRRQKSKTIAEVPLTAELRKVIARTPDIAPAFVLSKHGKPYTPETIGNMFGNAARSAGMEARLHGLRKAFCVYWAEKGATTHQIAAMAGHMSLSEVERYTRAADRTRLVKLLMEVA